MINNKKIIATIQVRMTSTRLPGKALMPLYGKPCLERIIERLKRSKYLDDIVVATTINKPDDVIVDLCKKNSVHYYRGSEEDVLLRVLEAAKSQNADIIVEICGDRPCVDWRHIDHLLEEFFSSEYDFVGNSIEKSFPVGFDVMIFPTSVLADVEKSTQNPVDREHVSLYIYMHPEKYRLKNWKAEGKMFRPDLAVTIDTKEDYEFISKIYNKLYPINPDFSAEDVVGLLEKEPEFQKINKHIARKNPFKDYVK